MSMASCVEVEEATKQQGSARGDGGGRGGWLGPVAGSTGPKGAKGRVQLNWSSESVACNTEAGPAGVSRNVLIDCLLDCKSENRGVQGRITKGSERET